MFSNPWSILDGVLFILPIPAEIGSLLKVKTKRLRIKIIVIIWLEIFLWTVRISIDQLVAGILFRVIFWEKIKLEKSLIFIKVQTRTQSEAAQSFDGQSMASEFMQFSSIRSAILIGMLTSTLSERTGDPI